MHEKFSLNWLSAGLELGEALLPVLWAKIGVGSIVQADQTS